MLTRGLRKCFTTGYPIMTICMNAVVLRYIGNNGINAYSVISYISAFTFAVILGVAEGCSLCLVIALVSRMSKI